MRRPGALREVSRYDDYIRLELTAMRQYGLGHIRTKRLTEVKVGQVKKCRHCVIRFLSVYVFAVEAAGCSLRRFRLNAQAP